MKEERDLEDLFCDWCVANESFLQEDNRSEFNYLGNIIGWEVKYSAEDRRRSRLNYKKCYIRDKYTCQYCDYSIGLDPTFRPLHIDHLLPWSASGSNKLDNLVVACQQCNCIASDKIFRSFGEKKAYVLDKLTNKKTYAKK
jgi:5-methylcytosine-specific restriction endonuclease McrA